MVILLLETSVCLCFLSMNAESLKKFRERMTVEITELREKLREDTGDTDPIAPDVSIGRLSRLDSMQMQQMALHAKRRQQDRLRKLEEALIRIDNGAFGVCVLCRQAIDEARLEAQPEAVMCVSCAP